MKLSMSNIAWTAAMDSVVYDLMQKYNYPALEIAPTRVFSNQPYNNLNAAAEWRNQISRNYNFTISSMQSIWYGKTESIFGSVEEQLALTEYTKKAIDFAAAIGCGNLVFGCPRNRILPKGGDPAVAISFFKELGDYAFEKGTIIGMEANPPIYNTNYINDTLSALELIQAVNSKGFLLNLDIGTIIQNQEKLEELDGKVSFINHIHISEPGLKIIEKRSLHQDLKQLLENAGYGKFVSIEMGMQQDISGIERTLQYVREVFNCK